LENSYIGRSIVVLVILLSPVISFAQFVEYSNDFLNIGAGARGLAMGSAQVATVKDGTAGYWNPAGLVGVKDNVTADLMHAEYFSGIGEYDFGAIAIPIQDNKRTLGLSVLRFAVDDIPNTLFLVQPDGSINYNDIQSFSSSDYAVLLSFAQNVRESKDMNFSFGINAKIIYQKVGTFATAYGFGIDAGMQAHGERWHFGAVGKDITSTFNAWTFSFTDAEKQVLYLTGNDVPVKSTEITAPSLIIGGGYDIKVSKSINISPEASFDVTFDGKENTVISGNTISVAPSLGVEVSVKNIFFIRGGITNFQQGLADGDTLNQKRVWIYQPSLGAGFTIQHITLDYAFTNLANQSSPLYTNVFSLRLVLSKKKEEIHSTPNL
jgi:hypothetical protein